jgi:hypothetical protein
MEKENGEYYTKTNTGAKSIPEKTGQIVKGKQLNDKNAHIITKREKKRYASPFWNYV